MDKDTASSSSDQLHPDPGHWEKNASASWYREGSGLLLMWSSSIGASVALREDCCSHECAIGLLDGTLWHSNDSLHLPLRTPTTWQPSISSTIQAEYWLVGLPPCFFLICIQRRLTVKCYQHKCTTLPGAILKISTPEIESQSGQDKSVGRPYEFVKEWQNVF